MHDAVTIGLVGIGGYGSIYVSALLDSAERSTDHQFIAAVDPFATLSDRLEVLRGRQIPVYHSLPELYHHHKPALVVISSPFHLHAGQTIEALEHGSHVLCEKPMCVTVRQAEQIRRARDRAGRHVAIGYQWSFSPAIQRLKSDIRAGVFGAARQLKTIVLWPRDEMYYGRNSWAGKQRDEQGNPIFDSPVSNACAHYLHNMFYVLGAEVDRSAVPVRVKAELYRAHPIENYDTAALRCWTDEKVEILFIVSHATRESYGPEFRYEFEKAVVTFAEHRGGEIIARFADGTVRNYGSPWESSDTGKLWATLRAIRANVPTVCGIDAAVAQTQAASAAQDSTPSPVDFPPTLVRVEGQPGAQKRWVDGLEQVLQDSYLAGKLPSQLSVEWARPGRWIDVPTWRAKPAIKPAAPAKLVS